MLALIGWLVIVLMAVMFIGLAVTMFVLSAALQTGETVIMGVIMSLLGGAFTYGAWVNVPFDVAMKVSGG